jgi:UDP-N-acetylmuramoylalanine--D-glutamate ligase
MELKGKRVLVLGMGETGISAARWLQSIGAEVFAADSRENPPRAADQKLPIATGPFKNELLDDMDLVVVSPGLSLKEPVINEAIKRSIPVAGDVELFAMEIAKRNPEPSVIAITGSNGKSTVTSMVGEMCRNAGLDTVVAGNIGLPVLDTLDRNPSVYVLELSSFQLETLNSLNAKAAVVLNLSEDHLDRYDSMNDYGKAKSAIFKGDGVQVLNRDDAATMAMRLPGRKMLSFGLSSPNSESEYGLKDGWLMKGERRLMQASNLKVAGLHNVLNALASLALCSVLDVPEAALVKALSEFSGLPHRVEKIGEIGGVAFYDDSKGTNVGATVAALVGLPAKSVLILGGEGKGQDFSPLKTAVENHSRAVVLIGRDAPVIERAIHGIRVPVFHASSMDEAVAKAYDAAKEGDAVLLSPACASFDMFRNYVHRAEAFSAAYRKLETCTPR